ncbi:MAG: hypothetical protein AAFZ65_15550 [Planctomycetota bacterium]
MLTRILAPASLLSTLASTAFGLDVLSVDGSGGPGAFTTIQAAVDVAQDGDVILVDSGIYGSFSVDGKALDIAARPSAAPSIDGRIEISGLPASGRVLLSGLSVFSLLDGNPANDGPALTVSNCAGRVRLQTCTFAGADNVFQPQDCQGIGGLDGRTGLELHNSQTVILSRCTVSGGNGVSHIIGLLCAETTPGGEGGDGIASTNTNLVLFSCSVVGGLGGLGGSGGDGGNGVSAQNSNVFVASTNIQGGGGGFGFDFVAGFGSGGDGGDGIEAPGGSITIGSSFVFGANGGGSGLSSPGEDGQSLVAGQVTTLESETRVLDTPWAVFDNEALTLSISGEAGDLALLLIGTADIAQAALPFEGLVAVGQPLVLPLGTVGDNGLLVTSVSAGPNPVGVEARTYPLQAAVITTDLAVLIGTSRHATIVSNGL